MPDEERTRPSGPTEAAEAEEARAPHAAGRGPTPEEEAKAPPAAAAGVAEHEREMTGKGAEVEGEGQLP